MSFRVSIRAKMKFKQFLGKRYSNGNSSKEVNCGWIVESSDSHEGPSTKIKKSKWIESELSTNIAFKMNPVISDAHFIDEFSRKFSNIDSWQEKGLSLLNDPFQVAVIEDFLSDKTLIKSLVEEIQNMEWTRKQMDLYEFYQTTDLANVTTPYLQQFYKFINNEFRSWMQGVSGMKFQKVSASCSMYNNGDFLLSHDDLLTDRLIAYVFYLSPWESATKWTQSMGGALELFSCDTNGQPKFPVSYKVYPANNQLAFFKVEKKSHHQVGEVLSKEFPRLTINGWFHGYKSNPHYDADAVRLKKSNMPKFQLPNSEKCNFEEIINESYLKDDVKESIQKQIEENSEAALCMFLKSDFLLKISDELKTAKWNIKGPANQSNYEVLDIDCLRKSSKLLKFINMITSEKFYKLLHEYTELDLQKNRIEFQRWKGGCYTLIGDPSTYQNDTLDLIFYIGNNESVGVVNYLTPEGHQEEDSVISTEDDDDGSVLLTVYPQNNSLNLVYRSSGTANFIKYCYKSGFMKDKFNYILFCSYKE